VSWRAFIMGLVAVAVLSAIIPYNDFGLGNTLLTGNHFPVGAFFVLLLLTFGLNAALKLMRRTWALRRSELMLIWCMMMVAATVPSSGLLRNFFPVVAAPAYYANRADFRWEETVVPAVPDALILSKDLDSVAVTGFFEGYGPDRELAVPWREWVRPALSWGVLVALFYLATLCMCSMLRKQWVENEKLTFPLAKVPLELSESNGGHLLPAITRSKPFRAAVVLVVLMDALRVLPILRGKDSGVSFVLPLQQAFAGSDLWYAFFGDAPLYPMAVGFAFLIPAHVSFSIWFFRILTRFEYLTNYWLGLPLIHDYAPFTKWQQAGAFIAFTGGVLWIGRRHLYTVFKKAVGIGAAADDSCEPVSYRLSFWGFILSFLGMVGWSWYFGISPLVAVLIFAMMMCVLMIHARLVCQGGMFFTAQVLVIPDFVHGLTAGGAFGAKGAVVAHMQEAIFMASAREALSPYAMNALRISEVFNRGRRLFLPVMLVTLGVAIAFGGWSSLLVNYHFGACNIYNKWGSTSLPMHTFNRAEDVILGRAGAGEAHLFGLASGVGVMGLLVFLRARFYWWPLHPLGFLIPFGYVMRVMWLSFFLGWLIKVSILRFARGRTLRAARDFFMGVIIAEAFVVGVCAAVGLATDFRVGYLFLPP